MNMHADIASIGVKSRHSPFIAFPGLEEKPLIQYRVWWRSSTGVRNYTHCRYKKTAQALSTLLENDGEFISMQAVKMDEGSFYNG